MNTGLSSPPPALPRALHGAERHRWRAGAACRGMDTESFFPTDTAPHAAEPALEVCRGCRVRSMCLVEALLVEDPARRYGVLGATTPQDRRRLHRTARVAARRSTAPAAVPTPGSAAA
ncbi:WhiB family transcriptional regulator [Pseudonocardia sp. ICBG1142]|uniref:WhiB family transcriptional regulator n=1 Tax=Pseudonocardia sp. ICBG1142 TaxID=2846760 RepID=UPI001CF65374|nr:WhiB family transcriptional regulator [Pseudonocardia sp. ICBG1142]